jgi:hypothetical protein
MADPQNLNVYSQSVYCWAVNFCICVTFCLRLVRKLEMVCWMVSKSRREYSWCWIEDHLFHKIVISMCLNVWYFIFFFLRREFTRWVYIAEFHNLPILIWCGLNYVNKFLTHAFWSTFEVWLAKQWHAYFKPLLKKSEMSVGGVGLQHKHCPSLKVTGCTFMDRWSRLP